jgi:hypothetical protein
MLPRLKLSESVLPPSSCFIPLPATNHANRVSVTKRNYSQEAFYALSSSYYKKQFYLDDVFG